MIEPASLAKPIVTGPHTENFRDIVAQFIRADALIQLRPDRSGNLTAALARELIRLLEDSTLAAAMGARARALLTGNSGATNCVMAALRSVIDKSRAL